MKKEIHFQSRIVSLRSVPSGCSVLEVTSSTGALKVNVCNDHVRLGAKFRTNHEITARDMYGLRLALALGTSVCLYGHRFDVLVSLSAQRPLEDLDR